MYVYFLTLFFISAKDTYILVFNHPDGILCFRNGYKIKEDYIIKGFNGHLLRISVKKESYIICVCRHPCSLFFFPVSCTKISLNEMTNKIRTFSYQLMLHLHDDTQPLGAENCHLINE